MKKIAALVLAGVMTVSLGATAFAESGGLVVGEYTREDVLDRLQAVDEAVENADQQAANGAGRLAEMLICAAAYNADDEDREAMQNSLDSIKRMSEDENNDTADIMGSSLMEVALTLNLIAEQTDPEGVYEERKNEIYNAYYEDIDTVAVEDTDVRSTFPMISSIQMLALIVEEGCSSEDQVAQLEEALAQCSEEFDNAAGALEQQAVGAKWLFKMLGAFVKVQNENNAEPAQALTDQITEQAEAQMGPMQETVQWLYGSVQMASVLA